MPRLPSSALRSSLVLLLIIVGAGLYYRGQWDSRQAFLKAIDHDPKPLVDFTRFYVPAARSLWSGEEVSSAKALPKGYVYGPLFALLLAPFTTMAKSQGQVLWTALQLLAMVALLVLPSGALRRAWPPALYVHTAAFMVSFPLLHNLKWGQVSTFMVLTALAALFALERNRRILSAVILALGVAVKFYTLPLALPLALHGGRRWLLAFCVAAVVFAGVVPAVVFGGGQTFAAYEHVAEQIKARKKRSYINRNSQSVGSIAHRWLPVRARFALPVAQGVAFLALLVCGVLFCGLLYLGRGAVPLRWQLVFVMLLTPFFVGTSWAHYFCYLPFVQTFLLAEALGSGRGGRPRWRSALLWSWPLSVALGSSPFFVAMDDWNAYAEYGALFWSNALLLIPTWRRLDLMRLIADAFGRRPASGRGYEPPEARSS